MGHQSGGVEAAVAAPAATATGVSVDAVPTSAPMSSMDAACRACFCSISDGGAAREITKVAGNKIIQVGPDCLTQ